MKPALLLDLDDTLVIEEPAARAAFLETARAAAAQHEIDPERLAADAKGRARELWYAAPTHPFCARIGISSWEGLWCRFEGDGPDERALREWSPAYRREAWRLALADQAVDDVPLAEELSERFASERRARHEVFEDVTPEALDRLRESHRLALVTNGAACLQAEKIAASGLGDRFDAVVVSAEVGVAKPDAAVFERALSLLGADRSRATMVGDSLVKDVDGALALGLDAIWINRAGNPRPPDRPDLIEIPSFAALPEALAGRSRSPACRG